MQTLSSWRPCSFVFVNIISFEAHLPNYICLLCEIENASKSLYHFLLFIFVRVILPSACRLSVRRHISVRSIIPTPLEIICRLVWVGVSHAKENSRFLPIVVIFTTRAFCGTVCVDKVLEGFCVQLLLYPLRVLNKICWECKSGCCYVLCARGTTLAFFFFKLSPLNEIWLILIMESVSSICLKI